MILIPAISAVSCSQVRDTAIALGGSDTLPRLQGRADRVAVAFFDIGQPDQLRALCQLRETTGSSIELRLCALSRTGQEGFARTKALHAANQLGILEPYLFYLADHPRIQVRVSGDFEAITRDLGVDAHAFRAAMEARSTIDAITAAAQMAEDNDVQALPELDAISGDRPDWLQKASSGFSLKH